MVTARSFKLTKETAASPHDVNTQLAQRLPIANARRVRVLDGRPVEEVDRTAILTQVTVSRAGRLLASHDRCWAGRQTLTDPAHVEAAAALRHQFQAGPPQYAVS